MKKKHIIIGASAAGMGVLSKLRGLAPEDDILCVAAQKEMPFNTCLLADYLSTGTPPKGLYTRSESFFKTNNIDLRLDTRIIEVEPERMRIKDAQGEWHYYDTLFIGTGQSARKLKTDFSPREGFFTFHALADVLALESFMALQRPKTAIVVGAGFSGIECADALMQRGITVTVVDPAPYPLAAFLSRDGGGFLEQCMLNTGVSFYGNSKAICALVDPFTGHTVGVALDSGMEVYADMVISAIGSVIAYDLLLTVQKQTITTALATDKYLRTCVPTIYAGGDTATVPTSNYITRDSACQGPRSIRTTTWPEAVQHGMIAASNMAGRELAYAGATVITSSHFFGTSVVAGGNLEHEKGQGGLLKHYEGENWHHDFVISNGRLAAFSMIGNTRNVGHYRKLLGSEEAFEESILDPLAALPAL